MEVDSSEVVRVVLQFLQESGLQESRAALERETGLRLGGVKAKGLLLDAVRGGQWADALRQIEGAEVGEEVLWQLYEAVVADLVLAGEDAAAKLLLGQSEELKRLATRDGRRFDALQDAAYHDFSAARRAIVKGGEAAAVSRREALATALDASLEQFLPSRLLQLLGVALRQEQAEGLAPPRLMRPVVCGQEGGCGELVSRPRKRHRAATAAEADPKNKSASAKLCVVERARVDLGSGPGVRANALAFGHGGGGGGGGSDGDDDLLVSGLPDGIIEVWSSRTGKLRTDLAYQAQDELMMHKGAVLGLALGGGSSGNADKYLASCSADGAVKVWHLRTGKCKTKIRKAHGGKPVNSVCFSAAGDRLVTAGDDHAARVFGRSSGSVLAELLGHTSQVTAACFYGADDARVATASSDHTVRLWNPAAGQATAVLRLDAPVNSVTRALLRGRESLVCCPRAQELVIVSADAPAEAEQGQQERIPIPSSEPLIGCVVGTDGVLYAYSDNKAVVCVELASDSAGAPKTTLLDLDAPASCLAHHPHRALLAVGSSGGVQIRDPGES